MKLFSLALNKHNELQVIGNVNMVNGAVVFQGLANGLVICQDLDYDLVRETIVEIFQMNLDNKLGAH